MKGNAQRAKQRGFSLIEVLVALFIVGVSLPAMVMRMQGILDQTIHIENTTHAHWVAENQLQQLMVEQELNQILTKQKKHQDIAKFGGREWSWNAEVIQTELPEMFRVNLFVSEPNSELVMAQLSGFIYQPPQTTQSN